MTTTPTAETESDRQYAFSNSSPQGPDQLASLAACLDPITAAILAELPVKPGQRCLEVGAGGGSIASWLADQVGPSGRVVAVDTDTSRLAPTANVEVHQHDIRTGLPDHGPFDVIHARLVLVHLPERRHILRQLVNALAAGGWLILGEFGAGPLHVYTSPSPADADLFTRVTDTMLDVLHRHGVDMDWADDTHTAMVDAGLRAVHTVEHAQSWTGGSAGCRLHHSNSLQKQDELVAAGRTIDELIDFRALMDNPGFSARSYRFVCTRGQKPMDQITTSGQ